MMKRMEETKVTARQRIVVALGGNAIQQGNDATVSTQLKVMETTADASPVSSCADTNLS